MFAGHTHQLPFIRNYDEAHKHFTKTKKPPRSAKWADHERPLKDARSWHYRIEKSPAAEAYDVCLYHTVMARFYKPDADGVERRMYRGHDSQTSRQFLSDVLDVSQHSLVRTTNGEERVVMPVYTRPLPGSEFSVDAYFDPANRLIVERSSHTRHYKRVSSATDKDERKIAKALFTPLLTLAAMRMPEWTMDMELSLHTGGLFSSGKVLRSEGQSVRFLYEALSRNETPLQEHIDAFMSVAYKVLDAGAHVRADKAGLLTWSSKKCSYEDIKPITEREFTTALFKKIADLCNLNHKSDRVEYPQFPKLEQITLSNIMLG